MNRSSPKKTQRRTTGGLRVDHITQMITENWPEIWQAAVDRQAEQLELRRVLLLAALDQLRQKAS